MNYSKATLLKQAEKLDKESLEELDLSELPFKGKLVYYDGGAVEYKRHHENRATELQELAGKLRLKADTAQDNHGCWQPKQLTFFFYDLVI